MKDQNTQHQLALDIFGDYSLDGRSILESSREIGYFKNNICIDVADLGLVARKALNVCHFIAAGSVWEESGAFSVDLEWFKWLLNYDKSNNLTNLKKALRDAQKAAVQVNVIDGGDARRDTWISAPMLGATAISGGRVIFKIPVDIQKHLQDPESYTYLSLRITAAFVSSHSLELYEKLSSVRFKGGTDWMPINEFRAWAGLDKKTAAEFRYLRRDVLNPAIAEINEISDIFIGFETRSEQGSKRIAAIRFSVRDNPDGKLNLRSRYSVEIKEIYNILTKEFALSNDMLDEIMANRESYTDERIQAAIDFTRARLAAKSDIKYPGLYLMKALRENLKLGAIEVKNEKQKAAKREKEKPADPPSFPDKDESRKKSADLLNRLKGKGG